MSAMTGLDPEARYVVRGFSQGIAFRLDGPEMQDEYDDDGENVTEWSGYQIETGRVLVVMVGDDRRWAVEPDDLSELEHGAWCPGCGATGGSCYGEGA